MVNFESLATGGPGCGYGGRCSDGYGHGLQGGGCARDFGDGAGYG